MSGNSLKSMPQRYVKKRFRCKPNRHAESEKNDSWKSRPGHRRYSTASFSPCTDGPGRTQSGNLMPCRDSILWLGTIDLPPGWAGPMAISTCRFSPDKPRGEGLTTPHPRTRLAALSESGVGEKHRFRWSPSPRPRSDESSLRIALLNSAAQAESKSTGTVPFCPGQRIFSPTPNPSRTPSVRNKSQPRSCNSGRHCTHESDAKRVWLSSSSSKCPKKIA